MPIYEFLCNNCQNKFDKISKIGEIRAVCPKCEHEDSQKLISSISQYNSSCPGKCSHNCSCK